MIPFKLIMELVFLQHRTLKGKYWQRYYVRPVYRLSKDTGHTLEVKMSEVKLIACMSFSRLETCSVTVA